MKRVGKSTNTSSSQVESMYKGHRMPMWLRERLRQANTGRHHSQETKKKISLKLRGRIPWNKGRPSSWNTGLPWPDEVKRKISEGMLRRHRARKREREKYVVHHSPLTPVHIIDAYEYEDVF